MSSCSCWRVFLRSGRKIFFYLVKVWQGQPTRVVLSSAAWNHGKKNKQTLEMKKGILVLNTVAVMIVVSCTFSCSSQFVWLITNGFAALSFQTTGYRWIWPQNKVEKNDNTTHRKNYKTHCSESLNVNIPLRTGVQVTSAPKQIVSLFLFRLCKQGDTQFTSSSSLSLSVTILYYITLKLQLIDLWNLDILRADIVSLVNYADYYYFAV